mmetsp:Transcript_54325/g.174189  ORF Transcript_54325/g.174189 Transcript_54325/m.174189 type:complete len:489 (-) Transcript_54325:84-1550(-)
MPRFLIRILAFSALLAGGAPQHECVGSSADASEEDINDDQSWLQATAVRGTAARQGSPLQRSQKTGTETSGFGLGGGFEGQRGDDPAQLAETQPKEAGIEGDLVDLVGTWSGKGRSLVYVPSTNEANLEPVEVGREGTDFRLQTHNYSDRLTFALIGEKVVNRGYTNAQHLHPESNSNQILGGVQYEQNVFDIATGTKIHHENGQWLYKFKPEVNTRPWNVTRMALIPHGNALVALGNVSEQCCSESMTTEYISMLRGLQQSLFSFAPKGRVQCNGFNSNYFTIPCSNPTYVCWNPLEVLIEQVQDVKVKSYTQFSVSTKDIAAMGGGGAANIPFINKNAQVEEDSFFGFLWLLRVAGNDGVDTEILQYAQVFQQAFKTDCGENSPSPGTLVHWPHIQASSLTRTPDSPTPRPTPSPPLPTPAPTPQPPPPAPPPTPAPAPSSCAGTWGDCTQSRCCQQPDFTCFEKDHWYAQCRPDCPHDWKCADNR